jgi:nucleoside-diphosphate-sugar epimerase
LLLEEAQLARIAWLCGDIADTQAVDRAVASCGARAVIHLAALQVPFCKADPVAGAKANVLGTVNVFEAARNNKVKRVAYASSIAALGAPEGSPWAATLYGAYKLCDEHIARVYWQDHAIPSVGMRPGVVYGVGRDQGMSSKTTVAILAAAAERPYTVPFSGTVSWLHAGEVASAFVHAVAAERQGAPVFNINGQVATVEESLEILRTLAPGNNVACDGVPLAFPMDLSDAPLRAYIGNYGEVPLRAGITATFGAFRDLLGRGLVSAASIQ